MADHVDEEDKGVTKCDVPQIKGKSSYTVDIDIIKGLSAIYYPPMV